MAVYTIWRVCSAYARVAIVPRHSFQKLFIFLKFYTAAYIYILFFEVYYRISRIVLSVCASVPVWPVCIAISMCTPRAQCVPPRVPVCPMWEWVSTQDRMYHRGRAGRYTRVCVVCTPYALWPCTQYGECVLLIPAWLLYTATPSNFFFHFWSFILQYVYILFF